MSLSWASLSSCRSRSFGVTGCFLLDPMKVALIADDYVYCQDFWRVVSMDFANVLLQIRIEFFSRLGYAEPLFRLLYSPLPPVGAGDRAGYLDTRSEAFGDKDLCDFLRCFARVNGCMNFDDCRHYLSPPQTSR